jgi:predicted transcriptional regulator
MHFYEDNVQLVDGLPPIFRQKFVELQKLDNEAETLSENVKDAKKRLFTDYGTLSKAEIDGRSKAIKEDYKKIRDVYTQKCELSSKLEQLMDRVNNKVKKDTDEFRYELELENPGCTFGFEKSEFLKSF